MLRPLTLLLACRVAQSFAPTHNTWPTTRHTALLPLQLFTDANKARTDIRIFLTQRAVQSFVFLLHNCRDSATVRWLEKTYDFKNLDKFHGTGAFNLTQYPEWDSLLNDLLFQPNDVMIVSAKQRQRGSKDNPYFKRQTTVDFEIEIDPPSLVSRIVSVRDQIANEWKADLETLKMANEMILDAYYDNLGVQRNEECLNLDDEECVDTDDLAAGYGSIEDKLAKHKSKQAYDRSAMIVLGNNIAAQDGRASSPFRKSTFDLLGLLATQESIHRVLRQYRDSGEERVVSFEWLRDFYVERVNEFFDGNQQYGRADDFMEELLLSPVSMKTVDGKVELIDPLRIAEDIISMRSQVADFWKEIIHELVTADHQDIRKSILQIQMGKQLEKETEPEMIFEEGFQ